MSIFRSKKKNLDETTKSLENLQVSEENRRAEKFSQEKQKDPTLRTRRGKYDLSPEESSWLLEVVYKREDPSLKILKSLLKVFENLGQESAEEVKEKPVEGNEE